MNSRKDTTRKLNIETLAKREVFAANVLASMALPVEKIETMIPAWHNVDMPSDVNRDGAITPMDALFRINSLNQDGARKLPASKPASAPFYDANGDDWLSPVDAIAVINELNKTPLTETVKQGLAGKGADVAEKVDQHNAKPNPGFTIAAESLAKINSIKPIHADNGTDDTEAEEQKLIKEMGWTKADLKTEAAIREMGWDVDGPKANAFREDVEANGYEDAEDKLHNRISLDAISETLGLSEEKTREIRKRFEQRSQFDRVSTSEQNDVKLDAVAAFLNVSVDDMRDKGISPEQGLLIAASIQEGGLEKTPEDYIKSEGSFNDVMVALAKDTAKGGGLDEDFILKNSDSFRQDVEGNYVFTPDDNGGSSSSNDEDPLTTLKGAEVAKGVDALMTGDDALVSSSDPGMGNLSQYQTGAQVPTSDSEQGTGSPTEASSTSSSKQTQGETNSIIDILFEAPTVDKDTGNPPNSGKPDNRDGSTNDKTPTSNDGNTPTSNDDNTPTSNDDSNATTSSNSNLSSNDEDNSKPVTITITGIDKNDTDMEYDYYWKIKNENGQVVDRGKTECLADYCSDNYSPWYPNGRTETPVNGEYDAKSHQDYQTQITGNCDGMNPWTNGKRKAPERITQNPGDIDPINPNFVDAVISAEAWAQERWAREGLGKTAPHNAPSATPNDNPNSEADGHTCPESGEG